MASVNAQFTRSGYERLVAELEALKKKRRETIAEVKMTREYGDLRENVGYHAAREAYGIIEGQIQALEQKLDGAVILPDDTVLTEVTPGVPCTVELETGQTRHYTVVDGAEVGLVDNGISADSPIGEALLYARIGDQVEAEIPSGVIRMTVTHIGD